MTQNVQLSWFLVFFIWMASCRKADDASPNSPPVAVAQALESVKIGSSVLLDGSSSTDINKDSLFFSWQFISKPELSKTNITGYDQKKAEFIPDRAGIYMVRLLVSDGIDNDSDTTLISASTGNAPPVAHAGSDIYADLGSKITLDGSGSLDPDGSALSYLWSILNQPPSSKATLNLNKTVSPTITIDKAGTYTIIISVDDGELNSRDTVLILTNPPLISGISPNSGSSGTEVIISGKNFDNTIAGNSVSFNNKAANILDASYTQLKVTAPVAAGTGKISLTTAGKTIMGPVFTYYPMVSQWSILSSPFMMAMDETGNLFVTGYATHIIYKIDPEGTVTIFSGSGKQGYADGKADVAQFSFPSGIAVDAGGNVFVADYGNHCIRKINPSGVVSTFAGFPQAGYLDGPGNTAQFNNPAGLAIDPSGNLYVTEIGNDLIRKITAAAQVTTIAGSGIEGYSDGTGKAAQFNNPIGITLDQQNNLLIADAGNNRIRKIDSKSVVTTIAGTGSPGFSDGSAATAKFNLPYGVTVDDNGLIYIADVKNSRIRLISGNEVSTYAGKGVLGDEVGIAPDAAFSVPSDVLFDIREHVIYITDYGNNKIKKIIME